MNRKAFTALALSTIFASSIFAAAKTEQHPKLTMKEARVIALKKASGTVKSAELENEGGKLIYSFDIATTARDITEVNVDANTGRIVAVQHENAAKEAAEKKSESKETSKH